MYCVYVDESGSSGADKAFVMCGFMFDSRDFKSLNMEFSRIIANALDRGDGKRREFKTSEFIRDGGMELELSVFQRREIVTRICERAVSDGRKILGIGIFPEEANRTRRDGDKTSIEKMMWLFGGMFVCALLQNRMQNIGNGNEKAELRFDDHSLMPQLLKRLKVSCKWYDGLYDADESNRFDRIANKGDYLGFDSRTSPLVQVADVISYVYRRHLEISNDPTKENNDDREFIQGLFNIMEPHRERLENISDSECYRLFKQIAHPYWSI